MYNRLNIVRSDEHLEKLIKIEKEYYIQYNASEEEYDSVICNSHVIIGSYKGETVYGYILNKGITPREIFRQLHSEHNHFINVWIMANAKVELKQPPKEKYNER